MATQPVWGSEIVWKGFNCWPNQGQDQEREARPWWAPIAALKLQFCCKIAHQRVSEN